MKIPVGLHTFMLVLVWLYAMVTVVGELGWSGRAKDFVENRSKLFNGLVFAALLVLLGASVWVGAIAVKNGSASSASLAYASAFY